MAQQYTTDSGLTLTLPGAYAELNVQNRPTNNGISGVLIIVGEADAGPRFDQELKLRLNAFGPSQKSDVIAKYKSGPIVDAFNGAITASNDPQITGSPTSFIIVKTNEPGYASATLPAIGGGTYGTLTENRGGQVGNLFYRKVTENQAEVTPSTGPVVWTKPYEAVTANVRVNGGAAHLLTLATTDLPDGIVTKINALSAGATATGGVNREIIVEGMETAWGGTGGTGGTGTMLSYGALALSAGTGTDGLACTLTLSVASAWNALPVIGDTLIIPSTSVLTATAQGSYVVCSVSSTQLGLYKLTDLDDKTPTAVVGQLATDVVEETDVMAFSPIVVKVNTPADPGQGQSLEIADTSTGTLSNTVFTFNGASASPPASLADWTSTSAAPWAIPSSAEYGVTLNLSRQLDAINQDVTVNGKVILTLGVAATTASCVIAAGVMTLTVTGGAKDGTYTITLSQFPTINDLVANLQAQGFTAAAATTTIGQTSPLSLDEGTYTFATSNGALTGRIKADGVAFSSAVSGTGLAAIDYVYPATALVGLPNTATVAALAGGGKGGTTNTDIAEACLAMQKVRGNFVLPLFSCDATVDIADGLTDSSSTYDLASLSATIKAHCLFMSQLKQRKPRLGLMSFRGTYADAKEYAGNMAQARCFTFFQDVRDVNSLGTIVQFRPWMGAVKAAGMQAAGVYKAIVNKYVNVSGALQAAGDFDDDNDDQLVDALQSGLCPMTVDEVGAWKWASDQSTYTRDNNWIFNSLQAMYVCDLVATTAMLRCNLAFVGQSVADISASIAAMVFGAVLDDFVRQKWLAPSSDAPRGWRGLVVKLQGPALIFSAEIKVAGAIYFVPITFAVTQVTQTATG